MLSSILEKLGSLLTDGGFKLLGSAVLFIVCWKLIGLLIKIIKKDKRFAKVDPGAQSFLLSCVSVILKVLLVLTVAANLGVPMTNVAAIVGLAVGLALQGSLSNFAGGIMILIFHPFRVGDYIESGGKEGTVKSLSLMSTVLTTPDNKDVIIPNGSLINSVITNFSTEKNRRVDLEFTVALGTDTERVKKILSILAEKHELVLSDPAPMVRLTRNEGNGHVFTLRVWVEKENYWNVRFDLLEQAKEAFEKLEIRVPCPKMNVLMDNK